MLYNNDNDVNNNRANKSCGNAEFGNQNDQGRFDFIESPKIYILNFDIRITNIFKFKFNCISMKI